jgi:hypothetical protein
MDYTTSNLIIGDQRIILLKKAESALKRASLYGVNMRYFSFFNEKLRI